MKLEEDRHREARWETVCLPSIPLCHLAIEHKCGSHHGDGLYLVNRRTGLSVPASVSCSAARPSPRCINAPCRCRRWWLTRFPVATSGRLSQSMRPWFNGAFIARISAVSAQRGAFRGLRLPSSPCTVPLFNTQHTNYITPPRGGKGGGRRETGSSTNRSSIKYAF